ncbi:vanadium-dependent haloperoxidase [Flavobacteriales bacterium]|nr:vanadium-dependent haloperoxidase [Flavobacteriales bacterium]
MNRISIALLFAWVPLLCLDTVAQAPHTGSTFYGTPTEARISAVDETVARQWNEVLLEAIRGDFARPTVHARNLFHSSVAMYDALAIYHEADDPVFLGNVWRGFDCPLDTATLDIPEDSSERGLAIEEAMSFAVYRLLTHRFSNSPGSAGALSSFDALMTELGHDADYVSQNVSEGPAALGNYLGAQLIAFGLQDGSNEQQDYANQYYEAINPELELAGTGNPNLIDPNAWQPLAIPVFVDQSGNVLSETPDFQGAEWGFVESFALEDSSQTLTERNGVDWPLFLDCGVPPLYGEGEAVGDIADAYAWGFSLVALWSAHLHPADGVMLDIGPGNLGNLDVTGPAGFSDMDTFYNWTEGGDFSEGHEVNPATGEAYSPNVVPRGDYSRVLAEFWADGPDSETPPGHWFVLLNGVMQHPDFTSQWLGEGDALDALQYTVRAYLTLGGAMHDAAIAAWSHKGLYDYIRPVSAIRYMASLGQRSDSTLDSYHPGGMPLVPGRIEVVEAGDPLASGGNQGKIKVLAWQGPDAVISPLWDEAEVGWILAEEWWPYQRPSFVTPPFAGYVSGHSTFSRAAAEVLTAITGSPFFPGGMGEYEVVQNQFLVFEDGPSQTFNLQWATYRDASDQCSLSRIWGGIHPPADDFPGRQLGVEIAELALNRVTQFFAPSTTVDLCPLDLDGDGVVGATDLLEALADFGSYGPALTGDVNGDEVVGVNDVLELLASYGESCP